MFQKKGVIVGKILKTLLIGGAIIIASQSPTFLYGIFKNYLLNNKRGNSKYTKKKIRDIFSYLKNNGYISVEEHNKQIYISLTEEGKKLAGRYQIDSLKIKKPKRWDRKWRIIIFDIDEKRRIKREAFRSKLKNLDFCQLQKSVWVSPYDCQKEITLLRDFFNLSSKSIKIILAEKIEDDKSLRSYFKID